MSWVRALSLLQSNLPYKIYFELNLVVYHDKEEKLNNFIFVGNNFHFIHLRKCVNCCCCQESDLNGVHMVYPIREQIYSDFFRLLLVSKHHPEIQPNHVCLLLGSSTICCISTITEGFYADQMFFKI